MCFTLIRFGSICWMLIGMFAAQPACSQSNTAVSFFPLRQFVGERYETVEEIDFKRQAFRVRKHGLYGLIDQQGLELLAPEYDQTDIFGWAFMPVRKNNQWGAVNRKGKLVIPVIYDAIEINMYCGWVTVHKDSLSAVLNEVGQVIVPFGRYTLWIQEHKNVKVRLADSDDIFWRDSVGVRLAVKDCESGEPMFTGGWRACRAGQCALFNSDGQQLSDFIFPEEIPTLLLPDKRVVTGTYGDDHVFLYDLQGNLLLDTTVQVFHPNHNLRWVSVPGMHGFWHKDGKIVEIADSIAPYPDWPSWFERPRKLAKTSRRIYELWESGWEETSMIGWVDMYSGRAMRADFREVNFQNDRVVARRADTTWVYGKNNQLLQMLRCFPQFFPEAAVGIYYQDEKYGLIDTNFHFITPPQYESIEAADWGGLIFKKSGKLGLLDQQGKEILPPFYEDIVPTEPSGQWLTVTRAGKKGVMDLAGKTVLELQFDHVETIAGDLFVVKSDGKYGLRDRTGIWRLPMEYDSIRVLYHPGLLLLQRDGYFGLADFKGQILLPVYPPLYDQLHVLARSDIFAIARRGNRVELLKKSDDPPLANFAADYFEVLDKRFLRFWRDKDPYLFDLFQFKEYRL